MGKLADVLRGRKSGPIVDDTVVDKDEKQLKLYNDSWLLKVSNSTGFIINKDREKVRKILDALNRRNGYCPCGGNGNQFLCPCTNMRESGICKCGLFENVEPVNPTGKSTAKFK